MRLLSRTFRSVKIPNPNPNPNPSKSSLSPSKPPSSIPISKTAQSNSKSRRSWCVYLILSTKTPIKTYVGVTTNFTRRLKQHNGEVKGGAKASLVGRPWVCACIIQGFSDQSEACGFESKWKSLSRKSPRKRKNDDMGNHIDDGSLPLLQHRQTALDKVKGSFDCGHLQIDWQLNPF